MSQICFHCNLQLNDNTENRIDDSVSITRAQGQSFNFHVKCFEEIAGGDYIPERWGSIISPLIDIKITTKYLRVFSLSNNSLIWIS